MAVAKLEDDWVAARLRGGSSERLSGGHGRRLTGETPRASKALDPRRSIQTALSASGLALGRGGSRGPGFRVVRRLEQGGFRRFPRLDRGPHVARFRDHTDPDGSGAISNPALVHGQ